MNEKWTLFVSYNILDFSNFSAEKEMKGLNIIVQRTTIRYSLSDLGFKNVELQRDVEHRSRQFNLILHYLNSF